MFWRKTRAAMEQFHPLHQALIHQRAVSVTIAPAEWAAVLASLARHETTVKRRKWRLPPRVRTTLVPLIRVLSEDVAPDKAIGVNADLRGPKVDGKVGPQRQLEVRRPVRKAFEWFAIDPWLSVRAELRDGSVLELAVVDRVRYRKIHKVNPRGKHKVKTKSKTVQRVTATRTLPKDMSIYRPPAPPPGWIKVKVRTERRPVISAVAKLPQLPPEQEQPQAILTVATELFRWTPPAVRRPA